MTWYDDIEAIAIRQSVVSQTILTQTGKLGLDNPVGLSQLPKFSGE
jgi:hypothetical protein